MRRDHDRRLGHVPIDVLGRQRIEGIGVDDHWTRALRQINLGTIASRSRTPSKARPQGDDIARRRAFAQSKISGLGEIAPPNPAPANGHQARLEPRDDVLNALGASDANESRPAAQTGSPRQRRRSRHAAAAGDDRGRGQTSPCCYRAAAVAKAARWLHPLRQFLKCLAVDPFSGKPKASADSASLAVRGILPADAFGLPLNGRSLVCVHSLG